MNFCFPLMLLCSWYLRLPQMAQWWLWTVMKYVYKTSTESWRKEERKRRKKPKLKMDSKNVFKAWEQLLGKIGPEITLQQNWSKVIVRGHCCTTIIKFIEWPKTQQWSCMLCTKIMWRKERLWKVGVLQKVFLSNFVSSPFLCLFFFVVL